MDIDVVIIGINSEKTLEACLNSVLASDYHLGKMHVFYVDGGSSDRSLAIAHSFSSVTTIPLKVLHPTPGLGRNKGWQAGSSPLVQFLDSDTVLDSKWLTHAVSAMQEPQIAAVRGLRKEMYPTYSIYNWIADQEWNEREGDVKAFGGDVLIKRDVLEQCHGYNEELIGGEDPELSLRMRLKGYRIVQMDVLMTWHDLNMTTFKQYFRRSYRTGYAFAAVRSMHHKESSFWKRELTRVLLRGGGGIMLGLFSLFFSKLLLLPAFFLLFYPLTKIFFSPGLGLAYPLHCSIVVIPQFLGAMRYYWGSLFHAPLHNTRTH